MARWQTVIETEVILKEVYKKMYPAHALFALVIGILILLVPRMLNYLVAVYLIVIGILGLIHRF